MKNKKGFTLIELLAIIVILAIIAVITVPIILNIIDNSRMGAAQDSAYGYKDAVNKWYVSELSKPNNGNFNLASSYTVTDGKLNGSIEIPVSGEKPSSGYLNYSNNILTSGCLVFGDYAVTFNGNGTSTTKGECEAVPETTLYYTYDANAAMGFNLLASEKLPEPDDSWQYYIKETPEPFFTTFGIKATQNNQELMQPLFVDEDECNSIIDSISEEDKQSMNPSCVEFTYKKSEVCGVENNQRFCLKYNYNDEDNYEENVQILNRVFNNECTEQITSKSKSFECNGTIKAIMSFSYYGETTYESISLGTDTDTNTCIIGGGGISTCGGH